MCRRPLQNIRRSRRQSSRPSDRFEFWRSDQKHAASILSAAWGVQKIRSLSANSRSTFKGSQHSDEEIDFLVNRRIII